MDDPLRIIITHVVTFAVGYLSRFIEPSARLIHWFPGWVTFAIPSGAAPPAPTTMNIATHSLTIKNAGWRTAHNVEIVHGTAPQWFRFIPQVNFTQGVTPAGDHVISIGALAPREWVTLQVLTLGTTNFPPLRSVRSHSGASRQVSTQQTFAVSPMRRRVIWALLILGSATAIYWLWRIVSRAVPPAWEFIWK